MKRKALALLLACAMGAAFFGLGYGLGLSALFQREKTLTTNAHYGVVTLLPEEAPEYDPGTNAYLQGDPRRSLIPVLREEEYEKLNKHSAACPIHPRYMTLGVSGEYLRLPPPEGYYDYADRLVVEAAVQAVRPDSLELTGCVFLGGREEALEERIEALLPADLAEAWSAGDRTAFSLRTWREKGEWRYRVDPELVPGGGTRAEEAVSMAEDNRHGFDLVFAEDMRWLYRVMQGELRCVRGRMLEETDMGSRVCVVSEAFLRENGLELGDSLSFRVGDKLCSQFAPIGAVAYTASQYPRRWTEERFAIIGTFADAENGCWSADEFAYAYSESTVFVPLSALPDTVYRSSARYTPAELTLLPAGGDSLARKLGWLRETASALRLRCLLEDRGWPEIAAGITGEETRLRAKTRPVVAGAAAILALTCPGPLLWARRKCVILRLAGAGKRTAGKRSLLPALALLWAAAVAGTAGAALCLRAQEPSLRETWAAFLELSGQGLPLGTLLPVSGLSCLVLSGGTVLAVLPLMRQELRALAAGLGRKAGRG